MNKRIYKRLMIAGMVPWRPDVLKKTHQRTEEQKLIHNGWQYVNSQRKLSWKNQVWSLLFKVIDNKPRELIGFDPIETPEQYQYIEFMAVCHHDGHVELYAYGNFIKGIDKAYIMRGRQLIKVDFLNSA